MSHFAPLHCWSLSAKAGDSAEQREAASLNPQRVDNVLRDWLDYLIEGESLFYLATCHRVELYYWGPRPGIFLEKWRCQCPALPSLKKIEGLDAVLHLARVTASLESEVLGETQITGQVKEAANRARGIGVLRSSLDRVIQFAQRFCKSARSQTAIGEGSISVAHVAVEGIRDVFESFEDKQALIVGAGAMALQSLERIRLKRFQSITWINRTRSKIEEHLLAKHCNIGDYKLLHQHVIESDVVVFATASGQSLLDRSSLEIALKEKPSERYPKVVLDLGLPRNVDASVAQMGGIFLRNVDEFNDRASRNRQRRLQSAEDALQLLEVQMEDFIKDWNYRELRRAQLPQKKSKNNV